MKVSILIFILWLFSFGVQSQSLYDVQIDTLKGVVTITEDTVKITLIKGYEIHTYGHIDWMPRSIKYYDSKWMPIKHMILDFTPYKVEE